jgi:hypothetical protein
MSKTKEQPKWLRISVVAAHFGVSEDTILRGHGTFGLLEIARPTERTALVLRDSFERVDRMLTEMATKKAS